jgi:hypothetical protein
MSRTLFMDNQIWRILIITRTLFLQGHQQKFSHTLTFQSITSRLRFFWVNLPSISFQSVKNTEQLIHYPFF